MKQSVLLSACMAAQLLCASSFAEMPAISPQASQAAAPTIDTKPSSYPALVASVSQYVEAWQKQDFKTMRGFESWAEGPEWNEVDYIRKFDADFQMHEWKVTKVDPQKEEGVYRVLVLVSHNLPKQIASLIPNGGDKKVKSTIAQLWKKQGDKFIHLFNIERSQTMQFATPPNANIKPEPDVKPVVPAEKAVEKPADKPATSVTK